MENTATATQLARVHGTSGGDSVHSDRPAPVQRPGLPEGPCVGTCVEPKHPALSGRVKVQLVEGSGVAVDRWLPTLHGLTFRSGDRVLVQQPVNSEEAIVVGVINGFLPRPALERHTGASIELQRDETLRVHTEDGQVLVEIVRDESGPIVRLCQKDVRLDVAGKLSIIADELELAAAKGNVVVEASDRVQLVGELIELN